MKSAEYLNLFGDKQTSHANLGKDFEDALEIVHRRLYATNKTGFIQKNNLDWVYTSKENIDNALAAGKLSPAQCAKTLDGRYLVSKQTKPDFEGGILFDWVKLATHILFDAKQTKGKSISLTNLKNHQIETLALAQMCGSLSGFMVHFSDVDRVFFLSALSVRQINDEAKYAPRKNDRAVSGSQSISIKTCEMIGVEVKRINGFWDWRDALVRLVK